MGRSPSEPNTTTSAPASASASGSSAFSAKVIRSRSARGSVVGRAIGLGRDDQIVASQDSPSGSSRRARRNVRRAARSSVASMSRRGGPSCVASRGARGGSSAPGAITRYSPGKNPCSRSRVAP